MTKKPFWLILFFIGFSFFLLPQDTDLGWHLRYGQHLAQTGIPWQHNHLAYFLENFRWPHSYTLYQLLTYLLWQTGQITALKLAHSLLFLIIFLCLYLLSSRRLLLSLASFTFLSLFGWSSFSLGWRAQNFSLLGIILTFLLIKRTPSHPHSLLLFPLLFFFWTNFHGSFILGLIVLALFLLSLLFARQTTLIIPTTLALLASFLATLINPFGPTIYQETLRHTWYPLNQLIAEWVPPSLPWQLATLALLALLLFRLKPSPSFPLFLPLLLLFTYLSLTARRHLPLFGLISSLTLLQPSFFPKIPSRLHPLLVALLALPFLLFFLTRSPPPASSSTHLPCRMQHRPLPCQATKWLRSHPMPPHVFAPYEWGGFLAWELPQYQYFVDGRMPTWPTPTNESPYTIHLKIVQAQPGWETLLDQTHTNWLFLATGTFLDLKLKSQKTPWHLIYQDPIATIYSKQAYTKTNQ